ncbi:MAG: hypothetical protein IPO08_23520 [Xanthomonadales bacterium]|nr:hypothetical protein [Xanthomonadales bacterium]
MYLAGVKPLAEYEVPAVDFSPSMIGGVMPEYWARALYDHVLGEDMPIMRYTLDGSFSVYSQYPDFRVYAINALSQGELPGNTWMTFVDSVPSGAGFMAEEVGFIPVDGDFENFFKRLGKTKEEFLAENSLPLNAQYLVADQHGIPRQSLWIRQADNLLLPVAAYVYTRAPESSWWVGFRDSIRDNLSVITAFASMNPVAIASAIYQADRRSAREDEVYERVQDFQQTRLEQSAVIVQGEPASDPLAPFTPAPEPLQESPVETQLNAAVADERSRWRNVAFLTSAVFLLF